MRPWSGLWPRRAVSPIPDDLVVLDNGMEFAGDADRLAYLWFHLLEREGGQEYELFRVVTLRTLRYLPQEARQEPGLVDQMRTVLVGLYNQRRAAYDLAEVKAGIFEPALGVLQMYGAVGLGDSLEGARRNALLGEAALAGTMANFPQSRLLPLTVQLARWVQKALAEFPHALVLIGQPEARLGPRGLGREGPGEMNRTADGPAAYTQQQAEQLCRAMAAVQEEFLWVTLASRLAQPELTRMLAGVAQEASVPASQMTGVEGISTGIALPISLAESLGRSAAAAYGEQQGQSVSDGIADSEVTSHVEGRATTVGRAVTDGWAHTEGVAHTSGSSTTSSVTRSTGVANTSGRAVTDGSFASSTRGGFASSSQGGTVSVTLSSGQAHSITGHQSHAEQGGYSDQASASRNQGVDVGASMILRAGYRDGITQTLGRTDHHGTVDAVGESRGDTSSSGTALAAARSVQSAQGSSWSASSGTSHSVTRSQATTTSEGVSRTTAHSSFASTTRSAADTESHAETQSWAESASEADGVSHGLSRSHGVSRSAGTSVGRSLGLMRGTGFGAAAVPSFALSRSYQWWNDGAVQLAQILRAQEELLRQATLEGGWLTDVTLLTRTERGAAAAEAAVRQAFQGAGPLVVTPVQTRRLTGEEERYVRRHAMCFTPSTREEPIGGSLEAYRDSTLLLPLQLAAYTAPVLFEEGLSITTQERIPAFAFVPDMPGDVVLAHLWSTERAELTSAPLRLSRDRMFHTVFAADTGFGKTVAAERLVVETTKKWHYRSVVLDFGAGWRRLLNAPLGEPGRVEVWQLFPGAPVPFRWNPWQVGRRIQPERQVVATCEIFKNAGRMGPRQLGFMRRAARQLYLENGVLTADREVLASPAWNRVRDAGEEAALNAARAERGLAREPRAGVHLEDLEGFERQALSVHRSKAVDMSAWVERLESFKPGLERKRDQASLQSLEGVLLRLEVFTQGEMARMYGSGEGAVAVEDLGLLGPADDPWGISILEGGAELDEYAKAAILGLVAWHLYSDAVVRRRQEIGRRRSPVLQIVFEEANKVLTGIETQGDERGGGPATATELYLVMWRDGRKYRVFLHPVLQTVSELPPGILSSCNNAFFSQTKLPADRDLMMAHLAFSEKGFTDEDYKRFISRVPRAMAIAKLGYSGDIAHTTPFLCRPVMVPAEEPADEEILARHRALRAGRRGR